MTAGLGSLAGFGAWYWLTGRDTEDGLNWPLRRVLEVNERVARAVFRPSRLSPEFPGAAQIARVNGVLGRTDLADGPVGADPIDRGDPSRRIGPHPWRLEVIGGAGGQESRTLSLAAIRGLPRVEQTTELKCIEGWKHVVHWAGARLSELAATTGLGTRSGRPYSPSRPPTDLFEYVGMTTCDGGYYVGLDTPSAPPPPDAALLRDERHAA